MAIVLAFVFLPAWWFGAVDKQPEKIMQISLGGPESPDENHERLAPDHAGAPPVLPYDDPWNDELASGSITRYRERRPVPRPTAAHARVRSRVPTIPRT